MSIIGKYNNLFFSAKGTNNKAKIGIRLKNGKIKAMTVQEVFNTYFINSRENERKMLETLELMGGDIKDIIQVLDIYNADYLSEGDYKFNHDQWESDKYENERKEKYGDVSEKERHEVNIIMNTQVVTSSVYRDLQQLFFIKKFHERRWDSGSKSKEFMRQRLGLLRNGTEGSPDLHTMTFYRTMGETEFKGISEWAEKYRTEGGNIKTDLTFHHEIMNTKVFANDNIPNEIPVRHHLGGYSQARWYARPDKHQFKFLVQFVLNKNAKGFFGKPDQLVLQRTSKNSNSAVAKIKSWFEDNEIPFEEISNSEGQKAGRIGLKNEDKEGEGLSISLGESRDTQEIFQDLLSRIRLIEVIAPD